MFTQLGRQVGSWCKKYLWDNNPAFVQMLGLCPLLAVSNSFVSSFILGLTTIAVMVASMTIISWLKFLALNEIRLPIFVVLISGMTLIAELVLKALVYPVYLSIGIFVPLIITNCIVLARADGFASKNPWHLSLIDAFGAGLGFAFSILIIGSIREILGSGSLFVGMDSVFSFWNFNIKIDSFPHFVIMILPSGAFFVMGFLVALKKFISDR